MIESLDKTIVLLNMPFTIEEKRVLRELRISGIEQLADMPEKNIARYIKKAVDVAYGLIEAKGLYRTFKLVKTDAAPPGVEGSPGLFFGKKIASLLEKCDYVSLLLTTIGPALPDRATEIQKSGPTEAYYLEHVGGWMADYLADRVDERITRECGKNGYKTTMRYSPGYGDWTLEAQPELLRLVEAEKLGVALTDTMIMIPRKSVSAAIGWVPSR